MTRRFLSALACGAALAAGPVGVAVAQPAAAQKADGAERVPAAGLTLEQALALPDTTVLTGNGKEGTVGELRTRKLHRDQAREGKIALTGGKALAPSPMARARLKSAAEALAAESSAAAAPRSDPPTTSGPAAPGRRPRAKSRARVSGVNGKTSGFILTPGAGLTIQGVGFGDAPGRADVLGQFPGGVVPLRVVHWSDDSIRAEFPEMRGVLDQAAAVQVVTRAGRRLKLAGGKFVATREEITLTSGIPRVVKLQPSNPPATLQDDGGVYRSSSGESVRCFAADADELVVTDPGRGFVVTGLGAEWGRTDAGDRDENGHDGSRSFAPGYGFSDWNGSYIAVRWGVWRSRTSPYILLPGLDVCRSGYRISVSLSGPAGVSPF